MSLTTGGREPVISRSVARHILFSHALLSVSIVRWLASKLLSFNSPMHKNADDRRNCQCYHQLIMVSYQISNSSHNGKTSREEHTECDAPQGTILGPKRLRNYKEDIISSE